MGRYHGIIIIRCKYKFIAHLKAKKMIRWIRKVNDNIDSSRLTSKILKYDHNKLIEYYDKQKRSVLNSLISIKEYIDEILDKKSLDFEDYDVPNAINELFSAVSVVNTKYPCCTTNVLFVIKRRKKYYDDVVKWDYGIIQDDYYLKIINEDKDIEWMVEYSYHI